MKVDLNKSDLRVQAGWLVDGTGGPIRENVCLQIHDGYILDISPAEAEYPPGGSLLDLSHFTIIPPLVDSHVHLFMSATYNQEKRKSQLNSSYDDIKNSIAKHISHHLSCGVFAVRDGGDRNAHILRYKSESPQLLRNPFRLKSAGKALYRQNRYGNLIGRALSGKDSLPDFIPYKNADHVKIVNSGLNSLTEFGKETTPQFSVGELKRAVLKARSLGLKTMVHANGKTAVNGAVTAGCDSIEHGFFMGRQNLNLLAEHHIVWVPTAYTMSAYTQYYKAQGISTDIIEKTSDFQLDQIRYAVEAGVPIAVGTDAGSIGVAHGRAVKEELKILIEAGFSISEAIQSATSTGAQLLGINDIGQLKKGTLASFLVIRGNPASLPDSIHEIESVYYKGKPINFSKLKG